MAKKHKGPRRGEIPGPFAWRTIEMLESPAYCALSLSARKILDRLEIELHYHGGNPFENGQLPLTFDHIEEYGVHRHAIGPAIRELVALGFIEITRKGCAGNASERQPNLYRLTYRFSGSNRALTDEWRRLKTDEDVAAARQAREEKVQPTRVRKAKSPVAETAPQKTKPQWRKPPLAPVAETAPHPVAETAPQTAKSPVAETTTTPISRVLRPEAHAPRMTCRYCGVPGGLTVIACDAPFHPDCLKAFKREGDKSARVTAPGQTVTELKAITPSSAPPSRQSGAATAAEQARMGRRDDSPSSYHLEK